MIEIGKIKFKTTRIRSGWVRHEIEIPDADLLEDVSYEGVEASDRLLRFCRGFVAGATGDPLSFKPPSGWKSDGIAADGIHTLLSGSLMARVSIARGLLVLSISDRFTGRASGKQIEKAKAAFLPKEAAEVYDAGYHTGTFVRYFFAALPGFKLDKTGEQPVAVVAAP